MDFQKTLKACRGNKSINGHLSVVLNRTNKKSAVVKPYEVLLCDALVDDCEAVWGGNSVKAAETAFRAECRKEGFRMERLRRRRK